MGKRTKRRQNKIIVTPDENTEILPVPQEETSIEMMVRESDINPYNSHNLSIPKGMKLKTRIKQVRTIDQTKQREFNIVKNIWTVLDHILATTFLVLAAGFTQYGLAKGYLYSTGLAYMFLVTTVLFAAIWYAFYAFRLPALWMKYKHWRRGEQTFDEVTKLRTIEVEQRYVKANRKKRKKRRR